MNAAPASRTGEGAVAFRPYALPLRTPYRWAKGQHDERRGLLVRLERAGATGFGEAAPAPHRRVDLSAYVAQAQALVTGLDVEDDAFVGALDARRPPSRLRCGIVTAWLSASAGAEGRSLARRLAPPGVEPAAHVPVNGLVTEEDPDHAAERAAELVAAGLTTLKVKCTADRPLDLARVRAVRQAAPQARLRLDPNESWPPEWALAHLEDLAEHRIDYVEQPLPRGQPFGAFAELRTHSPVRVALDESARDLPAIAAILSAGAADVLILKAQRLGGPDRTVAAITAATAAGVDCTVTASLETAVGLTMALQCASLLPAPIPPCGIGTARFFTTDLAPPPPLEHGVMAVPSSPGLGLVEEPF